MGQEQEKERREKAFQGYCVSPALLREGGAKPDAMVLHCLPAHRGEEIDGSFLEAEDGAIWDEAENRLHAQKALLEYLVR